MAYAIDAVLRGAVAAGDVPNVVAIAADRDGPIYEGAAGPRTAGQEGPVTPDTTFRIMSMTKLLATVAALQQVEAGRLDLDAPVEWYCPSFAEVQVLRASTARRRGCAGRPARRRSGSCSPTRRA